MQFRRLSVPDAYEFFPRAFSDDRGLFVAPFQEEAFQEAAGHPLRLGQSNHSVSRRGAIRGIHFADTPPGQAKYIYCPRGSLLDVVVDLRVGSPTFGTWDAVRLDAREYRAVYLAEGLGHGFVALEDDTVMAYLCSEPYNPLGEHGITPLARRWTCRGPRTSSRSCPARTATRRRWPKPANRACSRCTATASRTTTSCAPRSDRTRRPPGRLRV
jgi:epimerase EvaD